MNIGQCISDSLYLDICSVFRIILINSMFSIVVVLGAKMALHSSVNFAYWILFVFEHAFR